MRARRRWPIRAAAWCAVLLADGRGPALAALRDLSGAWLLDPPAIHRILDGSPPRKTGWWFGLGQTRLFGLPDLPVTAALGSVRLPGPGLPWSLGAAWQRTGRGLVIEDQIEAMLEVGLSPRIGLRWHGRRWAVHDDPPWSHTELVVTIGWGDGRPWTVSGRFPLTPPAPWRAGSETRPLALATWTVLDAGVAVGLDLDGEGRPRLGAELMASPGGDTALGLRADPATGILGLTLVWLGAGVMIRTSHLAHPDLGLTHRFQVGFGRPAAALR